jgi:hypothetical protein
MKVIPFPGGDGVRLGAEIDAALNGELAGPDAGALRELGEDVRALAEAPDAEFERELQARVAEWAREPSEPRRTRLRRRIAASPGRSLALGGLGAMLAAFAVVVVLLGGGSHKEIAEDEFPKSGHIAVPSEATPATSHHAKTFDAESAAGTPAESSGSSGASEQIHPFARQLGESATAGPAAGTRRQQLGASVTLAPSPEEVQEAADAVTRLGASYGGYVASSRVQVRKGGASEAQLVLSLPSAKLSQAIAALGRIAPERAVSQESQDITSSYEAARRRLSDDEAVRRALLRALAAATTQGEIESLRDRLASNRTALERDRAALHAVSHRASTAQLEVTIAGSSQGHALTVGRGLHDAGDVLATAGAVALIALAVLAPLALLALAGTALTRTWRRHRREAVLEP